jgi:hypothetical protein
MKSKLSTTVKKIGKYFREISVVVIGVAITLAASYWISNSNDKRDMILYIDAIRLELDENIKFMEEEADFLEAWTNYALYIASQDKNSIPKDSIRRWGYPGLGSTHNIIFQTSAFEMYKVSGAMRLLKDKDLLQSVWKSYLTLESVKITLDFYYQLKMEACVKDNQLDLAGIPSPIPLYDFFYSYANFGAFEGCRDSLKELKEVAEKLDKFLK